MTGFVSVDAKLMREQKARSGMPFHPYVKQKLLDPIGMQVRST